MLLDWAASDIGDAYKYRAVRIFSGDFGEIFGCIEGKRLPIPRILTVSFPNEKERSIRHKVVTVRGR